MSESGDYSPGKWAGHDFKSARRDYDAYVGRSYSDAVSVGKSSKDLLPDEITTDAATVIIFVIDQTGSMGDWPGTIRSKLGYVENEIKEYFGEDYDVIFMAIGDAHNGETYPLQARPAAKGLDMDKRIKELIFEGKGGSQTHETYELAALYALEKIKMPKAVNAIIIFLGDEQCYDTIAKDVAKDVVGVTLQSTITTAEVFKKLKDKMSVYHIRKPYHDSGENLTSDADKTIIKSWAELIGDDHIAPLPKAERVIDVTFGIFAKETGRIAYFEDELEGRQLKDKDGKAKVDVVYKSLRTIHKIADTARKVSSGKSVMRKTMKKLGDVEPSKKAKSLVDDVDPLDGDRY